MDVSIITGLILVTIFLLLCCLGIYIDYSSGERIGDIYIEFDEFKSLYKISPAHWELTGYYIKYIKDLNVILPKTYYLKFHFIDFIRYKFWYYDLTNKQEKEFYSKEYQEFRELIAQDLEKIKE